MCLIALSWRSNPRYALVLAANRDEFHARPTLPADFWEDTPQVLAGRDLQAGGTWLGITRTGRLAALSNVRDGRARPGQRSRGELVRDFLLGETSPADYMQAVYARASTYGGFNLLVGRIGGELWYFSNYGDPPRPLDSAVYAVSNGLLDEDWPKVRQLRDVMAGLPPDQPRAETRLFHALADTTRPEDGELPDTGIGLERERQLSPVFIAGTEYGTRASTLILVDHDGRVTFEERRFGPEGQRQGRTRRNFELELETGEIQ